jgi:hypothetical protein
MRDLAMAVAAFQYNIAVPPRGYAERTYNVVRYTQEPDLLAQDIHDFAVDLSGTPTGCLAQSPM